MDKPTGLLTGGLIFYSVNPSADVPAFLEDTAPSVKAGM